MKEQLGNELGIEHHNQNIHLNIRTTYCTDIDWKWMKQFVRITIKMEMGKRKKIRLTRNNRKRIYSVFVYFIQIINKRVYNSKERYEKKIPHSDRMCARWIWMSPQTIRAQSRKIYCLYVFLCVFPNARARQCVFISRWKCIHLFVLFFWGGLSSSSYERIIYLLLFLFVLVFFLFYSFDSIIMMWFVLQITFYQLQWILKPYFYHTAAIYLFCFVF